MLGMVTFFSGGYRELWMTAEGKAGAGSNPLLLVSSFPVNIEASERSAPTSYPSSFGGREWVCSLLPVFFLSAKGGQPLKKEDTMLTILDLITTMTITTSALIVIDLLLPW